MSTGIVVLATTAGCSTGALTAGPTKPVSAIDALKAPLTIAVAPVGRTTTAHLQQAGAVIAARLHAMHLGTATVVGSHILVTAATTELSQAEQVATDPGTITFRQVVATRRSAEATADPAINRGASVTPELLSSLAHWDCHTDSNPTRGVDKPSDYILACDRNQTRVFLLAPAVLRGKDVQSASIATDAVNGDSWEVDVHFTTRGSRAWFELTKQLYAATGNAENGFPDCAPPSGCNAIGIALDGVAEADPAVATDGIPGGRTVISDNFSKEQAEFLTAVLRGGQLPVTLHLVG